MSWWSNRNPTAKPTRPATSGAVDLTLIVGLSVVAISVVAAVVMGIARVTYRDTDCGSVFSPRTSGDIARERHLFSSNIRADRIRGCPETLAPQRTKMLVTGGVGLVVGLGLAVVGAINGRNRGSLLASAAPTAAARDTDLVAQLERLDALRRSGTLTDADFERAKARLLEPPTPPTS